MITGYSGLLGGLIANRLSANGHTLVLPCRYKETFDPIHSIINFDLNTDPLESILDGVETIIHCAGMNAMSSELNPDDAFEFNCNLTSKLARIGAGLNVKHFIYLSTVHVYSKNPEGNLDESSICQNVHPYPASKRSAEVSLTKIANQSKMKTSILRLSNVIATPIYKEVDCWNLIANDLCRKVISSGTMCINSPSNYKRDFIPSDILLDALETLIERSDDFSGPNIYNISSGSTITLASLANKIRKVYHSVFGNLPRSS